MRLMRAVLVSLLLCPLLARGERSVSVDTNGVVVSPTNLLEANNIPTKSAVAASNSVQDTAIAGKVSTNDLAYRLAFTNGTGSGATVTISNRSFHVYVPSSTSSAASVQANLDLHADPTNTTAHTVTNVTGLLSLLSGKASTNDLTAYLLASATNGAEWGSHAGLLTESTSLGVTNVTGGILSMIGRQISLVTSNLTAVLNSVYAAIVHDHTSTAITNAPWTVSNDVTNSLNLAIAPSLTGTVSKAATALQSNDIATDILIGESSYATNSIIASGCSRSGLNGTYYYNPLLNAYTNAGNYFYGWSVTAWKAQEWDPPGIWYVGGASVTNAYSGDGTPPVVVFDPYSVTNLTAFQIAMLALAAVSTNDPIYQFVITNVISTTNFAGDVTRVDNHTVGVGTNVDLSQIAPVTLTYTSTNILTDASLGNVFRVTLTNSAHLHRPTNRTDGKTVRWHLTQGSTGTNALTLSSGFVLPTGITSLTLSTAVGSRDILVGEFVGTNVYLTGLLLFGE